MTKIRSVEIMGANASNHSWQPLRRVGERGWACNASAGYICSYATPFDRQVGPTKDELQRRVLATISGIGTKVVEEECIRRQRIHQGVVRAAPPTLSGPARCCPRLKAAGITRRLSSK